MRSELIKYPIWKKTTRRFLIIASVFLFSPSLFAGIYEWGNPGTLDYHSIDNVKIEKINGNPVARLVRFPARPQPDMEEDSVYFSFSESFLDTTSAGKTERGDHYRALMGENIIKADYRTISPPDAIGKAASFEIKSHALWLRMPEYTFFQNKNGIDDFSLFFRIKFYRTSRNAEFFSRYGYYGGRKYGMAGIWDKRQIKFEFFNFFSDDESMIPQMDISTLDKVDTNRYYNVMLQYKSNEGSLTLFLDGKEQKKIFVTVTGEKYGKILLPRFHPYDRSPVVFGKNFLGSIDEFVVSNKILPLDPSAGNFGSVYQKENSFEQKRGRILGNVHKLAYSRSLMEKIEYAGENPESSLVRVFFRSADALFPAEEPESVLPFRKVESGKMINIKGRYFQFKVEMMSNSAGSVSPSLDYIRLRYTENPPPSAPKFLDVYKVENGKISLILMRNNEMDVINGGKYMVYYGIRPYEPLGKIYFKDIAYEGGVTRKTFFNDRADRLSDKDLRLQNRILLEMDNELIEKNSVYIRSKPWMYFPNPVLKSDIPYYFWVTVVDSAWEEDPAYQDHESAPSNTVVVRP